MLPMRFFHKSTTYHLRFVRGTISVLLLLAAVSLITNSWNGRLDLATALAALITVFCLALGMHVITLFGLRRQLRDVTIVRHREAQFLATARAATAEADILRCSAHTLAKSPRMDDLLDALLIELRKAVPYDSAAVLLREEEDMLMVARQAPRPASLEPIVTIQVHANDAIDQLLKTDQGLSLPDLQLEPELAG